MLHRVVLLDPLTMEELEHVGDLPRETAIRFCIYFMEEAAERPSEYRIAVIQAERKLSAA